MRRGARRLGGGGARSWVALRSVEARSRRICGLRALNWRGIRSRLSGGHRRREVDDAEPPGLPLGRQHLRPRSVRGGAAVEDDGVPGELPARHLDHVAAVQLRQRLAATSSRRSARRARAALFSSSETRWRSAAYSMKSPRSQVAASAYPWSASSLLVELPREPDDRLVRLELGERHLQQLARPGPADLVHEVDRHVVRRAEARAQRVGTGRGEAGDLATGSCPAARARPRAPRRRARGVRRGR